MKLYSYIVKKIKDCLPYKRNSYCLHLGIKQQNIYGYLIDVQKSLL